MKYNENNNEFSEISTVGDLKKVLSTIENDNIPINTFFVSEKDKYIGQGWIKFIQDDGGLLNVCIVKIK
jgi:subtilase family serine protease